MKNSGKTTEIVAPEHMRICIVDDDRAVANLIRKTLAMAGFTNLELYRQHHEMPPTPIREFRADIPEAFDQIIVAECMAKRKEDRPGSMKAIVDRLAALVG
jgi:hypothetical protein